MNMTPATFYVYSDILEFNCQNLFRSLSYHMPIHMQKTVLDLMFLDGCYQPPQSGNILA